MEAITTAIMAGAEAGKLRKYVRQNGERGLAGLVRLAERHSALATAALERIGATDFAAAPAHPQTGGSPVR